jgi:hypothetical protein
MIIQPYIMANISDVLRKFLVCKKDSSIILEDLLNERQCAGFFINKLLLDAYEKVRKQQ